MASGLIRANLQKNLKSRVNAAGMQRVCHKRAHFVLSNSKAV